MKTKFVFILHEILSAWWCSYKFFCTRNSICHYSTVTLNLSGNVINIENKLFWKKSHYNNDNTSSHPPNYLSDNFHWKWINQTSWSIFLSVNPSGVSQQYFTRDFYSPIHTPKLWKEIGQIAACSSLRFGHPSQQILLRESVTPKTLPFLFVYLPLLRHLEKYAACFLTSPHEVWSDSKTGDFTKSSIDRREVK